MSLHAERMMAVVSAAQANNTCNLSRARAASAALHQLKSGSDLTAMTAFFHPCSMAHPLFIVIGRYWRLLAMQSQCSACFKKTLKVNGSDGIVAQAVSRNKLKHLASRSMTIVTWSLIQNVMIPLQLRAGSARELQA